MIKIAPFSARSARWEGWERPGRAARRATPFHGLAAGLGVGLPLLLGLLSGRPDRGTLAAIGAYLIAVAAPTGPYEARARSMAEFIVVVAVGGGLGGLLAPFPWAVVAVITATVAGAVLLGQVKPVPEFAVLFTAVRPPPTHPLENMALMALGGLWVAAILLSPWPFRRLRPLGEALGAVAGAVAAMLDAAAAGLREPATGAAGWEDRRRKAAAAMRKAATTYSLFLSGQPDAPNARPQRLLDGFRRMIHRTVGLEAQIRALTAGGALPESVPDAWRSETVAAIGALAAEARRLSADLEGARPPSGGGSAPMSPDLADQAEDVWRAAGDDRDGLLNAALTDEITRTVDRLHSTLESARGAFADRSPPGPAVRVRPVARAADAVAEVRHRSALFQQAMRVALMVGLAMTISTAFRIRHGQWMAMTVLVTLHATYGETMSRVGQRVAGSAVGCLIAAVVLALTPSRPHAALAMTLFAVVAFTLRPLGYTYWNVFVTPLSLMLMDLSFLADWSIALRRILLIAAGGAIALVGTRVLWPRQAAREVPGRVDEVLSACADLTRAAAAVAEGEASRLPDGPLAATRKAIDGLADLRTRMENEPDHDPGQIERLTTLVEACGRIRDRLIAVAGTTGVTSGPRNPVARVLDRTADAIDNAAAPSGGFEVSGPLDDLDERLAREAHRRRPAHALPDRTVRGLAATRRTLDGLIDDVDDLVGAVSAMPRP
ncbi:FUSC family protein [Actinomadura decatromicini]|uniref:FUSC family protein n=1 Tax=Actinomadura decatromicini TaxID=2604572 RepID=A0A5D3FD93_9ACTN|nr:FUSC family protein [Actinomadura decatromicini]TYK46089.1 FUSC family protein [Actinomadura decatromicini]